MEQSKDILAVGIVFLQFKQKIVEHGDGDCEHGDGEMLCKVKGPNNPWSGEVIIMDYPPKHPQTHHTP